MLAAKSHKEDWENLATTDPLWAIASDPSKKGGRWDLDEFLQTGIEEAARVMDRAAGLGLPLRRESCLDFGCGVGRVIRALSSYFKHSVGVDISEKMLEMARRINPDCTFFNLADFAFPESQFDLVYSNIVLQHQPSRAIALHYIKQFVKMLAPGGLAIFQLPTHIPLKNRIQPRRRLYGFLRATGVSPETLLSYGLNPIRMLAIPESRVVRFIEQQDAKILAIFPCPDFHGIAANDYYVRRP